jgi:hypothetical protein
MDLHACFIVAGTGSPVVAVVVVVVVVVVGGGSGAGGGRIFRVSP